MKQKDEVTFYCNTQFTGETNDSYRDDQYHMEFQEDTCDTSTQYNGNKSCYEIIIVGTAYTTGNFMQL